jgi:acetone carboxylase alpha subunit
MVVDCPGPEEQEKKFPWLYLFRNQLERNVHGYGKHRGGVGLSDCFVIHGVPEVRASSVGTGGRFTKNYGLFGGYSGAANPRIVIRNSDVKQQLAASNPRMPVGVRQLVEERVIKGDYQFLSPDSKSEVYTDSDVIVLPRGSGGGYGDPLEREPEAVLEDLADGLISDDVVREIYAVELDGRGGVDADATALAREAARRRRLARGAGWDEFTRRWSERRPPEAALSFYGQWPVPQQRVPAVVEHDAPA